MGHLATLRRDQASPGQFNTIVVYLVYPFPSNRSLLFLPQLLCFDLRRRTWLRSSGCWGSLALDCIRPGGSDLERGVAA
jgi:hypothetical protein